MTNEWAAYAIPNSLPTVPFLVAFFAGYCLILVTPGPNMLTIGAFAALNGLRGVVPIALGLGTGAGTLALTIFLTAKATPSGSGWDAAERIAGCLLLIFIGLRIVIRKPKPHTKAAGIGTAAFGAGFCTAVTNPITGAFFLSQYLGPMGDMDLVAAAVLSVAIAVFASGKALVFATLFAHRAVREYILARYEAVTRVIGAGFVGLACWTAMPLVLRFHIL